MLLTLNSSYNIFTKLNTLNSVNLKVVGILNYDEAIQKTYNIMVLAINEQVVSQGQVDAEDVLKEFAYYYCVEAENPTNYYLIWDEIIDETRLTKLNAKYGYNITIEIPDTVETSITTIITAINNLFSTSYPTVIKTIEESSTIAKTNTEILSDKASRYETILSGLLTLEKVLPALKQVADGDFDTMLTTMKTDLVALSNNINRIASVIG